jgi:GT2 family glycosyltransferase
VQPRVTAILVARNGAEFLDRTLDALSTQTRRPDALVAVDAGSKDSSAAILAAAAPTQLVSTAAKSTFGSSVAHAVRTALAAPVEDEWIWLLNADAAPHPRALASLLGAVEIAPSVAVAGPKLMRLDDQATIARYGESITRMGASVILVEDELDQAQYDTQSDLLAVSESGMLLRRSVWAALGGFDPGLPTTDAALDFCIRARLAGHRVIGVPQARIFSAGGPELFGRTSISGSAAARIARTAQLHRRMVYARGLAPLFLWLSLLPIAILRSGLQLIRKQPSLVGGELSAALRIAFSGSVGAARRNLHRTSALRWKAIAPLRISSAIKRERRAARPQSGDEDAQTPVAPRASFVAGGGAGVVILVAIIGVIAFGPLLGAAAVQGGALLPLSHTVGALWANVGYGWHSVRGGFVGASDPFAAVLAVLGSLTFWSPSLSIVILYFIALPVGALGAWWAATRLSTRAWPPAIAALLWALAPPFLDSLDAGHLGAVIAHMLLPWLVLAAILAARSWAASAAAALLFAAIAASSPELVPALVVMLIAWIIARPRAILRLVGVLIPAAALFAPLAYAQVQRGTPLALLADPGLPTFVSTPTVTQLALGSADRTLSHWVGVDLFGKGLSGPLILSILLIPVVLAAIIAPFLRGTPRSVPSIVIALLGFVTAVAATHLSFETSGLHSVSVWPGGGLSLMWLGIVGAVVCTLEAIGRGAPWTGLVIAIASALAVAPLLIAPLAGTAAIEPGAGTLLPAFVDADAANRPDLGTLVLAPQSDGGISADIQRGTGEFLDDQSTLGLTASGLNSSQRSVAALAGNLASRSGIDPAAQLTENRIGFVLLGPATTNAAVDVRERAEDALNGDAALTAVGTTSQGLLWRNNSLPATGFRASNPDGGDLRTGILIGMGIVFLITLLLAVPGGPRRRRSTVAVDESERATLGEDDDD